MPEPWLLCGHDHSVAQANLISPVGLFEDSAGADGQVTAAFVTPPDALDDGLGELRGGQRAELAPSGSTKLNCIDLFAGAGGLATGLSQAGFKIELLVESDERVAAALTRNHYEHVECAEVQAVDFTRWRGGSSKRLRLYGTVK